METRQDQTQRDTAQAIPMTRLQRLGHWMQDPMGGVIAASVATIGSFGVVISGMWAINVALN
ncbi:MAG: hypothetical protein KDI04_01015 [Halieaceae bacterium]|nr:hypothetical protein [Halieaceae bacterium]MCP5147825.1 hypothetical protein [Pseudomonadales bacterium]MCP5167658.1 hypothetical protein [Pseudomonadales bacterium]MCP5187444.1 hypothetical protein [Pseudomonadales bacterium]